MQKLIMKIKKVDINLLEQIYEIEQEVYNEPWNYNFLEKQINSPNCYSYGLMDRDFLIGFIMIHIFQYMGYAHIINFAVRKKYQGLGYGKNILKMTHMLLKFKNISTIYLEVRTKNRKAINLYKKYNYDIRKKLKKFYKNDDDAFLMSLSLEK